MMPLPDLRINGQTCPVLQEQDDVCLVRHDCYLASLIVRPAGPPSSRASRSFDGLTLLEHGANTYSLFSSDGGWVIISPMKSLILRHVRDVMSEGRILGSANVARQWMFARGCQAEAGMRLGTIVARRNPGFHTMPINRQDTIVRELATLGSSFAYEAGQEVEQWTGGNLLWDVTPGLIGIPRRMISGEGLVASLEIIDEDQAHHDLMLDTLIYWWDSAYPLWWKGIW